MSALDRVRMYARETGPTWLAGAVAAGPATMASLVSGGAGFGYVLLWVVVLSAVLGALSQYLAARLGLLTEAGIVSVVEQRLGEGWAWLLVVDAVLAAGLAQLTITKTVAGVSAAVTGVGPTVWAVVWGVVLAVGLAGGGYRAAELGAKLLVSVVVLAFVASLFVVPVDLGAAAGGLVPRLPTGVSGALVAAGILGGAVHVTLVTMQSYTTRARGWTREDMGLARVDVAASMLCAFGVYSLAIFLVTAAVLYGPNVDAGELTATAAAQALGPLVGENARWLFLSGLWGASVSTLGANTVVPPFLLADKLGWERDVSDPRYRAAVVGVALAGIGGVFVSGELFPLLVLTLAFGLVGTPFALALVVYLLNDPGAVPEPPSTAANVGGVVLIAVTAVTAGSFLRERVAAGVGPVTLFVLAFAGVLGAATLVLLALFVRERVGGGDAPVEPTG
ncbi:NRAMP family divalent metal transporter [Candidatus Halobonum tyrrellensis]|uniref:Mn2+/Fe2-transporter, NRAMP family protein n=1 Tax=Candidatus Halobonum tyrrellensis G22 TaxID=1324957 RepID=V4HGU8_9EURY|nr:divalent metal cation transporter [Candidatus Halobonum tyrrellensis]ESP89930.1 Mn2+/Fe2- transporter, NRAMP family protein [Candidatus Halobonum tyrrellensis G22]